jgi:hypothetical protein
MINQTYYAKQTIAKLEAIATNILSGPTETTDVNVTNTSFEVSNFPSTQPISGSVSITGTPAVTVSSGSITASCSGSVSVSNFPSTQPISGSVSITGTPTVNATCSGTVAVSSLPSVSGSVSVSNFPSTQPISGSVSITGTPSVTISSGSVSVSSIPAITGSVSISGTPTCNVTQLNTNTIATNSGVVGSGVQRVCMANDDLNLKCMNNLGFDFRYLSLNSDTVYSKFTKVQAKTYPPTQFISGNASGTNNFGTGTPYLVVSDCICSLPSVVTSVTLLPPGSVTWMPGYDSCRIIGFSANDATAGTNARTVRMIYYDNNWVLQSVSHPLSNTGTTYNIRRVVKFEVETWGANTYNEDSIVLQHSVNQRFVCWIHQQNNKASFNHIVIPLNGYVLLDSLYMYASTGAHVKVLLWKQTAANTYTYVVIFHRYIFANAPPAIDLSYLDPIYGPTSSTENWGIVIGAHTLSAGNVTGNIELNGKIYTP